MAPLRYAAKFDPFLSLDCAPTPSTRAQSKERKGSNFAIWQPCREEGLETRERKLRTEEMAVEASKRKFKAEKEVERRKDDQGRRVLQVSI